MEKSPVTKKGYESRRHQEIQRTGVLAIIAKLTEDKQVATALREQLNHGIYIDLASVLAWEEWIRDELNDKVD